MTNKGLTFILPWPPSVNHYWGQYKNRRFIKKPGLKFREEVKEIVGDLPKLVGEMGIVIDAYPPDNRRRDLDNLLKATLDAMEKAGLYKDDKDFIDIRIRKRDKSVNGYLLVNIKEDFDL